MEWHTGNISVISTYHWQMTDVNQGSRSGQMTSESITIPHLLRGLWSNKISKNCSFWHFTRMKRHDEIDLISQLHFLHRRHSVPQTLLPQSQFFLCFISNSPTTLINLLTSLCVIHNLRRVSLFYCVFCCGVCCCCVVHPTTVLCDTQ